MNYYVFCGDNIERKNYVIERLYKETGFMEIKGAELMSYIDDDVIQNIFYDEETKTLTWFGLQFNGKKIKELTPNDFIDKMKELKPNDKPKHDNYDFKSGHTYVGEFKDPYNSYTGVVFSINGFLQAEGIKFNPKNPFFKSKNVYDVTPDFQLKLIKE